MRRLSLVPFALLLAAVIAAPPAQAGAYVGAAYLSTDTEIDVAVDTFDPDDSGFKFFGGFNIVRFLGVEASYRDLGTFQGSTMMNAVDAEIEVWDVSARGILPLPGPFTVFARAGYANVMVDGSITLDSVVSAFDEDEWELFYGAGVEITVIPRFAIRIEYEDYDVDDDLSSISAGALFRF